MATSNRAKIEIGTDATNVAVGLSSVKGDFEQQQEDNSIQDTAVMIDTTLNLGADAIGFGSNVYENSTLPPSSNLGTLVSAVDKAAVPLAILSSANVGASIGNSVDNNESLGVADTLEALSISLGIGAIATSPTGVGPLVLGGLSAGSASLAVVAGDMTYSDLRKKLNHLFVDSLGDMIKAGSNATLSALDPEEILPEISGSQQNQLMAISKTPSFNYTSHKKDSVAGYNLYQMLDNAEDTISNSTMNGFTVYVMGKTIQPTCMGDEAGVGGGIKSGTVGKEIRATSGAPSIMYCGYLSIRANDTCTMNNENVEGKYISLC